ncbi:MAG TPA: EamA family transporter, partial [Chloroflexia bacterium]|nr:EamA family transporter [Chloroflexia bacterium]
AAALWGTLGTVYTLTIAGYGLTPVAVVFYRAVFSALALGGWLLARRHHLLRLPRAAAPLVLAYGLLGVTVFYVAYIYAVVLVGVTTAVVLLYTAPALVALLAWRFLGETMSRAKVAALALTFAGVVLVAGAYDPAQLGGNLLGLACGILAAATYALYSIFGKLAHRSRLPSATLLVYTLAIGAAGLLCCYLPGFFLGDMWPGALAPVTLLSPGPRLEVWAVLITLGTVQTLAPVAAYTASLQHLDAGVASMCATLEPVVAGFLAFAVLREPLGLPELAGAGLILVAVALLQNGARR